MSDSTDSTDRDRTGSELRLVVDRPGVPLATTTRPESSAALARSPMKRARMPALEHDAAVVLGDVGAVEDADVLTRALDDAMARCLLRFAGHRRGARVTRRPRRTSRPTWPVPHRT